MFRSHNKNGLSRSLLVLFAFSNAACSCFVKYSRNAYLWFCVLVRAVSGDRRRADPLEPD
jgi:hypothetical protein